MKCQKCGTEIPEKFKFCPECGSSVSGVSTESFDELSIGEMRTEGEKPSHDRPGGMEPKLEILSDRYELHEEIGRGGFAVVCRATDKKLGRTVAIKQLHVGHDLQTLERFKREARVIAGLNHRNIVGVHDVGEGRDGLYLVMEYIEGGSLRDYLKAHGALELETALKLISGVLQGLAFAHRRNLVHRDIKPSNILLLQEGGERVLKIVDFGLAQSGRDSELSMTGYGMGSPYYMPPEQRRDAKNVNHTADIYAIGKVLYEMVSGEIPDTLDPSMIPSDELALVIFKCTKPQPHDRYFSVDELIQALDGIGSPKPQAHGLKPTGENACPTCGVGNPNEVKFCVKCGAGLTHLCGECGREESAHNRYCGACGSDIPGFKEASEILDRMKSFMQKMKWSRVQKEFSLFDASVRLPGKKGRALKEQVKELSSRSAQLDAQWKRVPSLEESKRYIDAYQVVTECLVLDPGNVEFLKKHGELETHLETPAGTEKRVDLGDGVYLELVWVPATTSMYWKKHSGGKDFFMMGSPVDEKGHIDDELQHEVKLTQGYWMGKYPVTQAQYEKVMGGNLSHFKRVEKVGFLKYVKYALPDHPVESISFGQANTFCKRVGALAGKGCRLPTEAQWEYACRAGTTGDYAGSLDSMAWYGNEKAGKKTHAVGQKQANAWGLYDMHGNVWEWCSDWDGDYPSGSVTDPAGASRGSGRVGRGGSWSIGASYCRSAYRYSYSPSSTLYNLGFRPLVLER